MRKEDELVSGLEGFGGLGKEKRQGFQIQKLMKVKEVECHSCNCRREQVKWMWW